MTSLSGELIGKQLGILYELLPKASHFGLLSDPRGPAPPGIAGMAGFSFGTSATIGHELAVN
jgi:hypothetical protein